MTLLAQQGRMGVRSRGVDPEHPEIFVIRSPLAGL